MSANAWAYLGGFSSRVSLTIFHSLWQGILVGLMVWMLLAVLRNSSPRARHLVCLLGLLSFAATIVFTFTVLQPKDISGGSSPVTMGSVPSPVAVSDALLEPPADNIPTEIDVTVVPSPLARTEAHPVPRVAEPQQISDLPMLGTSIAPISRAQNTTWGIALRSRILEWSPWITGFWLLGVFVLVGRSLGAWSAASRLRRVGTSSVSGEWQRRLDALASRMGIDRAVRIFQSTLVQAPVVIGWIKPTVLLPIGILTGLTPQQIEAILAHELAHIRRHDYLINLLQTAIETLLFYHPVTWMLSSRLRLEREQCCDDTAVEFCGGDRVHYAKTLCLLEERRSADGFALSAGEKPLARRIFRLLGDNPGEAKGSTFLICSIVLTLLVGANLWWQQAEAQEENPATEETKAAMKSGPEASLYVVTKSSYRKDNIWRVDFREGKIVDQQVAIVLENHQRLGYENHLVQQRYVVSNNGVIVDLKELRVNGGSGETLNGVTENEAILRKNENAYDAFDFSTNTRKSFFYHIGGQSDLRGARFSPDGKWLLQVINNGFSRQLVRTEDHHALKLDVECRIHPSVYSSNSYAPSPSLWLDKSKVLFAKSNSQLVLVAATTDGGVEDIVEIPDLIPGELGLNVPLDYHLFRDAAGNIVFDAEGAGAFRIDVEQKQWEPYLRLDAGNGFTTEVFQNMVLRQESSHDDWIARYYGRKIGEFVINRSISKFEESSSVAAIDGYLAIVDGHGSIHSWTAETNDWQIPDQIAFENVQSGGLIGWVDHRKEANQQSSTPPIESDLFPKATRNAEASLFVYDNDRNARGVYRIDFLDGTEVGKEDIVRTSTLAFSSASGNFFLRQRPDAPILTNRYLVAHPTNYGVDFVWDLATGEKLPSIGRVLGATDKGLINQWRFTGATFTRPHQVEILAHDPRDGTDNTIYSGNDGGYPVISPDGLYLFSPSLAESATFTRLTDGIQKRYALDQTNARPKLQRAALWLDNDRVLFNESDSRLIAMNIDGTRETVAEIHDLESLMPSPEYAPYRGGYALYRDPAGNIIYETEDHGAWRIDADEKSSSRQTRWIAGHGFEIASRWAAESSVSYYGDHIDSKGIRAPRWQTTDGYLAVQAPADDGKLHVWAASTGQWIDLGDAVPLGWIDHRQPARGTSAPPARPKSNDFIVHEWGVQVLGHGSGSAEAWTGVGTEKSRMLGPPQALLDDLPNFVGIPDSVATSVSSGVWRKPVIHCYGPTGTEIRVKIDTPTGVPFAYYPVPEVHTTKDMEMTFFQRMSQTTATLATSLEWRGKLSQKQLQLVPAPQGHWWNFLREVPSTYLQTTNGNERFLFYEATAAYQLPLDVRVNGDRLVFTWTATAPVGENFHLEPILICNDLDGGKVVSMESIPWHEGESKAIQLSPISRGMPTPIEACKMLCQEAGLTAAEARAIAESWKQDLEGTPGFLCLYRVPRSIYDAMFPITIEPAPDELVRVGIVMQRIDTAQGLPRLRPVMQHLMNAVGSGTDAEGERAKRELKELGAPAKAFLREHAPVVLEANELLVNWEKSEAAPRLNPQEVSQIPPGSEWFQGSIPMSARGSATSSLVDHLASKRSAYLRRYGDSQPDFNSDEYIQQSGWRNWQLPQFDVWWDERSESFRRDPGSRLHMITLPGVRDFDAAKALLQMKWRSLTLQSTDELRVNNSDFVALFQPGAFETIILTKPVPVAEDSCEVRYIDFQVYETPTEPKLFHPGSWDDFDLEAFTEIKIPLVDPKAARPNRIGHLNTEVPGLGNLQVHLTEAVPDWDSYTYREQDEYTYEVSSGESKTIIYPDREKPIWAINGAHVWGSDGGGFTRKKLSDSVKEEWPINKLNKIELTINGQQFIAPEAATANIFQPRIESKVLVSPDGTQIILEMAGSDGAGTYHMRWLFVNGEYRWRKGTMAESGWE